MASSRSSPDQLEPWPSRAARPRLPAARTDDRLRARDAAALDAFLARLQRAAVRHGDETAWITDPVTVRGDGRGRPDELLVRVGKLLTDSRRSE